MMICFKNSGLPSNALKGFTVSDASIQFTWRLLNAHELRSFVNVAKVA